jgi:hypothetical protein
MAKDWLRYDQMVEDALRGVVRRALTEAAVSGLPGDHHFYITFRTDSPSVRIPQHLKAQYPREMTIVLQHQFWGLSPHSRPSSIRRFASASSSIAATRPRERRPRPRSRKAPPNRPPCRCRRSARPPPVADGETAGTEGDAATDEAPKPEDAASKVVKLDSFRKK